MTTDLSETIPAWNEKVKTHYSRVKKCVDVCEIRVNIYGSSNTRIRVKEKSERFKKRPILSSARISSSYLELKCIRMLAQW